MNRTQKILFGINTLNPGLEIGASHAPIAPKSQGHNVKVMDHLSTEDLKNKYRDMFVDVSLVEDVDYVWRGESYKEIFSSDMFDYVIASHVIEHIPNIIGFFDDVSYILRDSGILALAIPDKRYCFDYFRPISSVGDILDAHYEMRTSPTKGQIYDSILYSCTNQNGDIAWGPRPPSIFKKIVSRLLGREYTQGKTHFSLLNEYSQAVTRWEAETNDGLYHDSHCWCFTPESFTLIMNDLYRLKLTTLTVVKLHETSGCEFIVQLQNNCEHDLTHYDNKERIELMNKSLSSL